MSIDSVRSADRRAIVMGASMAGLWAARVLADHVDEVVLIECDRLPDGPEPRPGAPQARQYHILRRHYEKLARWPDRYVVLGDAFCGFNPIYGQGMTVAALSAVALGTEIARAGGRLDGVAAKAERAVGR